MTLFEIRVERDALLEEARETRVRLAAAWLAHDLLVHPAIGVVGFIGRVLGSPRILALMHRAHNLVTPGIDAWADYAEAAKLADELEGRFNPSRSERVK